MTGSREKITGTRLPPSVSATCGVKSPECPRIFSRLPVHSNPKIGVAVGVLCLAAVALAVTPTPENGCCPADQPLLSPRQMKARLRHTEPMMPPPLGRKVRIKGTVVFVVAFDSSGRVTCVRLVSGPPLLVTGAMESLMRWEFQRSRRKKTCGTLVLALDTTRKNTGLRVLGEAP